ncbi:hypothetical protein [Flavobacterium chilense]|uniref:Uncharacterized protein n=1 Tax=Flavobacterium chilense TaxID=946677 RepID=A0A1M7N232_9FLAO|nr:hypothetical protein [Flavobacterium chilense]SHM97028.1 hypothetical protein SAMN05444484_11715 [Flavobacterium chilense]
MTTILNKKIATILVLFFSTFLFSQTDINQNGIKTSVISGLNAEGEQARRYEIASVGYNSHHWQIGGLIIIELYQTSYGTGYERYVVENGFLQGVNYGVPAIKLIESNGIYHSGKIALGTPIDLATNVGGYINKELPIFFDVRYYATYRIKITYLQEKVDVINDINQIKINQTPNVINIPDFASPNELNYDLATSGNLKVSGTGNHYIQNGNVGIGTTNPTSKLTVAGNIASREVKVTVDAGADFVFENNYPLPSLESVDKFIKENKHLPEVASAKEMQKDGINLSEMNIKLLQKIEEMTLYMIEMKKEMVKQNDKISTLENKLKSKTNDL